MKAKEHAISRIYPLVLAMTWCLLSGAPEVEAQASLASEDRIDEIPVTIDGVEETFTAIRDARVRQQWYYIPDRPRLFERRVEGKPEPEFTLLRYQTRDPSNPQEVLEGGLIQFAASLALPPEAIPQLKSAIRKQVAGDEPIRLSAMPFKKAKVAIYSPDDGKLVGTGRHSQGIAPVFSTQKMVFSVPLSRLGSDVYDALVHGNTGVAMAVEFSFNGLTPPAGFRVTVDWDQTYEHYSKDKHFAAKAGYIGYFGASSTIDVQEVYNELVKNKAIQVEITESESFDSETIQKYLEPLLSRINKELLADLKPPETVPPASLDRSKEGGDGDQGKDDEEDDEDKGDGGFFGGLAKKLFGGGGFRAEYRVSIKKRRDVKRGKETIRFDHRAQVERKTIAGGFIGIGRYPEAIREKLVTVVPEGPWKSAFFVLPAVGDDENLGITQVDLEIGLTDGGDMRQSQVVAWTPDGGWKDRRGQPRTVLTFPLMGLEAAGLELERARFVSRANVTVRREVLRLEQTHDVFDGETAIVTPLSEVDVVAVDGSLLSWAKVLPDSDLVAINVTLRSGERVFSRRLRPRNVDGVWIEPEPLYWLIPKGAPPVTAEIQFLESDGHRTEWRHNGRDLLQELSSLEVTLLDADWRRESGYGEAAR